MARPNPRKSQFVPNRPASEKHTPSSRRGSTDKRTDFGDSSGRNASGNISARNSAKTSAETAAGKSSAGKNVGSYSMEIDPVGLRIIGGKFRGSKLSYIGDRRVRPMKDRVREAAFNLIHSYVEGAFVLDLFGGTGALGLESLSRGAAGCIFTEQHFPTARVIEQNIRTLNLSEKAELLTGDVFLRYKRHPELPKNHPWIVFCSPPYSFFNDRTEDLLELLNWLYEEAPKQSLFVVESDTTFSWEAFDALGPWDIREYPPAVLGIHKCE